MNLEEGVLVHDALDLVRDQGGSHGCGRASQEKKSSP